MLFENIFNSDIYPRLKEYVESKSAYKPKIVKNVPLDSKMFPIVPIKLLPIERSYNNLNYGEENYSFGIEINIYAQDQINGTNKLSKKTICDEVTNVILEYLESTYHIHLKVEYDVANIDENVHRNLIRATGILDTKYGLDNLVIYPK